jgi:hypothetical protein
VLKRTKMWQAAFGESCLSRSKTFEWYSRFKSGLQSIEVDPRPGTPSTSHTKETAARVREIIRADRHLTIRVLAEVVRIASGTWQKILTEDLQMRCMTAKFVPRLLMAEQKDDQVSICTELRDWVLIDLTPSLLSWPCSVRLLLVPATEENNERLPIRLRWTDSSQRDEITEGLYKKLTTRGAFVSGRRARINAYKHKDTLWKRQDQRAVKGTHSLTKKSVLELNDQPT